MEQDQLFLHDELSVTRNESGFLISPVGDEMVLMDIKTGDYLALNPTGSEIWKLLEKPLTIGEIVNKLLQTYKVSRETCSAQVRQFLKNLSEKKMIVIG